MSVIQEAVDHLKAAVAKIDERLLANERERAQLVDAKRALQDLIGEPAAAAPSQAAPRARGGRHASVTRDTGVKAVDAANRVVAFLAKGEAKSADVRKATGLRNSGAARHVLRQLVAAKRIVLTGRTHTARYSLPVAKAAAPTPAPAKRKAEDTEFETVWNGTIDRNRSEMPH